MPVTPLDLVRNPDFNFYDLVHAQDLAAAATTASAAPVLGPTSSFCPHPHDQRIYDPKEDEVVCLRCGDIVSHTQLDAEYARRKAAANRPEPDLPV